MLIDCIGIILISVFCGMIITLLLQFIYIRKYFVAETGLPRKLSSVPFVLPLDLLKTLQCSGIKASSSFTPLNIVFQFIFHELRDTNRVRKWFFSKLTVEFEELLSKSTIGRMFSSIKVRDISLGSHFPVINSLEIFDVKINERFSHIDSVDLKLDIDYNGGFFLTVDANMMLGKTAFLYIKVKSLQGQVRLQLTRLPYSHWSFSFINDPQLQLHVESHFHGRSMPQITNLISSQIHKAIRKKHTLPNYKLRYKPIFTIGEEISVASEDVTPCLLSLHLQQISRLHTSAPDLIYCLVGIDPLPWIDIISHGETNYYLMDVAVTKKHGQSIDVTCRQGLRANKSVVFVERSSHPELLTGDVLLSVDGKLVTHVNMVPKSMRTAAIQATVRLERAVSLAPGDCRSISTQHESAYGSCISEVYSDQTAEEAEPMRIRRRTIKKTPVQEPFKENNEVWRLFTSKTLVNDQIVAVDEDMTLNILAGDKFLNIAIRGVSSPERLVAYINIPLSTLLLSSDSLHSYQLKPPDSFQACNSRSHELSAHNGFIPILCYGDIMMSIVTNPQHLQGARLLRAGQQVSESPAKNLNSSCNASSPNSPDHHAMHKHSFVRTHLQSSSQCQFCGKKIWLKDAEKCQSCSMTCHKKCATKCRSSTFCSASLQKTASSKQPSFDYKPESIGDLSDTQSGEILLRESVSPIIVTTEVTPPTPTPIHKSLEPSPSIKRLSGTRKSLCGVLASVASAGRGLKRAGSAHSLQLPDEGLASDGHSKSLPPSPQQSPSHSRKPSLPAEMSEEISVLLESLMEQGSDEGDIMCVAKATGKTLYAQLKLPQRKQKIQEMMNKLQEAIDIESATRSALEKQTSFAEDTTSLTKAAFLVGKSDEKTQSLTILMLHFCAGLQHIQDLEEQEE